MAKTVNPLKSKAKQPPLNTIDYNSPEYSKAFKEGTLVSEVDGNLMAPMLDEIELMAQRPGYLDKITTGEMANAYIKPGIDILNMPQAALTEGLLEWKDGSGDASRILPQSIQSLLSDTEGSEMRTTSDAFGFGEVGEDGIRHANGWLGGLGNFAIDAVTDPTDLIGVGMLGDTVRGIKQGTRAGAKSVDNLKFKSSIDWGKWNKEIPSNKALMEEYNQIESITKAEGSWMKNTDGSSFNGTPEQFVQQNSENFKKAFPEWKKMYHGSKSDNLQDVDISKNKRQAFGEGFYTTDNIEEAQKYAGLLKRTPNPEGTVYDLAVNTKNSQKFSFRDKDYLNKWNKSNLKSKEQFLKDYKLKYGEDAPDYYLKQADHTVVFKENTPNNMKDLSKNIILDEGYQNKWILAKDYPKSLMNNNGMFDITNPNIYKSLVPGVGLSAAALQNDKQAQLDKVLNTK